MPIMVVTDSTSDLPQDLAQDLGITVVPLNVHSGTEEFKDGVDLTTDEFFRRLVAVPELPKTSQPSVGDFSSAYKALEDDADGIVSVHISAKMSGTYNSAIQARSELDMSTPIEVIDTLQASMGLGLVAIRAATAARQGASFEEVAGIARDAAERCRVFAGMDTLEYLIKGGRIGKARGLVGTLLRIRPMILVREGEAHELGKERTRAKMLAKIQRTAEEFGPVEELCVLYSTTPEDADQLARGVSGLLPDGKEPLVTRFGPVLGTYVGPGAVGIGLLRADEASA